jgi:hypothetical protein
MKIFLRYTLIVGFMLLINLSADAGNGNQYQHRGGTSTAPLDGGLLAILAVAGVSYYAIRKKSKE